MQIAKTPQDKNDDAIRPQPLITDFDLEGEHNELPVTKNFFIGITI